MINLMWAYYTFVFIIVGFIGSFTLSISGEVYNIDEVLTSKQQFIKCIFMYQVAIWESLSEDINIIGMMILEILTTLSVWLLNVLVFLILIVLLILKCVCFSFYMIFEKR